LSRAMLDSGDPSPLADGRCIGPVPGPCATEALLRAGHGVVCARTWRARSTLGSRFPDADEGRPATMAPPPLVRRFEACADAVAGVRREAVGYAREHVALDPDGVALALSEAITNAVLHAYPDARRPGTVEVVA